MSNDSLPFSLTLLRCVRYSHRPVSKGISTLLCKSRPIRQRCHCPTTQMLLIYRTLIAARVRLKMLLTRSMTRQIALSIAAAEPVCDLTPQAYCNVDQRCAAADAVLDLCSRLSWRSSTHCTPLPFPPWDWF